MPLVCLSLTARTIAENLAVLERYRGKIDIAELRADLLDPSEAFAVRDFPVLAGMPCILSVRRKCDGGGFVDGEGQRLVILAKAIAYARPDQSANYAYVDLECDFRVPSVEEACHTFGTRIIRSRHDILGMPPDLNQAWAELAAEPGEIPKLAVTPRGAGDFARLFTWATALPPGERIIVGMGEYGIPSRVLAENIGSSIAYTSALLAGLPGAAPGHLDPIALEQTYRFRELDHGTAVYALGGGLNILTSKTAQLHNAAFAAAGINAVYVPIPAGDVATFLQALEATNAQGAAVTVPLKEALLPYLTRRSPEVDDIGACNTLVREQGGWTGYDTDAQGFERALLEFMGDVVFGDLRATIVGAGGVAKAIAHVLAQLGVRVVILNRTVAKARALAQRYCFGYGPCTEHSTELIVNHSDIIIQATSVGMEGDHQGDPLDWYDFSGRESVFDLIYRPECSMLLERALTAGCRTTNGWKMLRYQSAAQFALWTGREPPVSYFS
ncbi:MAG: type I 3-dehydroquinate dehydratase [Rectinemataceae bacterium]|jgi:3-dehydroquinate dehydratase/shikimate dehydrogenase